ncbi:MAG: cobalamin-binding protein, partial [Burkholderia sp.]|nr:cobalamin-binding protein [Burkholderia sp.]
MKLVDAVGVEHRPLAANETPRIVSLVPSLTELLCDLGLAHVLVGRTGFCIHPADTVHGIAKVGGTKDVNVEKIRKLAPTHLVVNIDENEKPTVEALAAFVPTVIVTHPIDPRDNLGLYRLLGGIFGADEAADRLCAAFEQEYAALAALPPRPMQRVLYCIWQDPWMTVARDTYIARMLALAGKQQWQAPGEHKRYPAFDWSDALVNEIDEVLLSSEPYRFTEDHVDAIERQTGKPARLVDGEMMS